MNFEAFQELELKYAVEDIKVNGIQMWPVLRIYIASQIVFNQDRSVKVNASTIGSSLKHVFHGWWNVFRKTRLLFFSSSDQRKKIGNTFIDKADVVAKFVNGTTIVELPSNGIHYHKDQLPKVNLVSKIPFYAIAWFLSKIAGNPVIESEEVLKHILGECGITLDYNSRIKLFFAEKALMKKFIGWKNLEFLFLTTPYTNMGYVYAFKEKGLPVVEFQHGTISKSHYAYHLNKAFERKLFPDYLLTFGRKEKEVFDDSNHYIDQDRIFPVGSLVIDAIVKSKPADEKFNLLKQKFRKVVAFTAQDALEIQFTTFLKSAALLDPSIAYVLIPRFKDTSYYQRFEFPENVLFIPWLSTYELMYMSDYHATINSTTALEAPSLGTRNVLANVEGRAVSYFKDFIDERVCKYADTPEDFIRFILEDSRMSKEEIASCNTQLFEMDFELNIKHFLRNQLSVEC